MSHIRNHANRVLPTINVSTAATGPINCWTHAIQRLSLASRAHRKLTHIRLPPVSGHSHVLPYKAIHIVWSPVSMVIHVSSRAVKRHSSIQTHWPVKNHKQYFCFLYNSKPPTKLTQTNATILPRIHFAHIVKSKKIHQFSPFYIYIYRWNFSFAICCTQQQHRFD